VPLHFIGSYAQLLHKSTAKKEISLSHIQVTSENAGKKTVFYAITNRHLRRQQKEVEHKGG